MAGVDVAPAPIRLSKSCLSAAEKSAVMGVLDRERLGMGVEVARFEEELAAFFGRPVVCVVNGTAALHLALQAMGIGAGDEVLVQSLTYLASFQAISASGAKPVACEIHPDTVTLDCRDAERRLTSRTKAVMPVHYSGGAGALDEVYAFAGRHGLRVIEDAAHAFGSTYHDRRIGGFGDVACFSFDGIKNITSGEGGCIVTESASVLATVRDARLLGVQGDSEKRRDGARTWAPTVTIQGWRYHMSDVMAAIGRVQLSRFEEFRARRMALLGRYLSRLADSPQVTPIAYEQGAVVPHIMAVRVLPPVDRDQLRTRLEREGIQTGIHYFPNHQLDFYRDAGAAPLPVTDAVGRQILSLPMHADLTLDDVDRVCDAVMRAAQTQAGAAG